MPRLAMSATAALPGQQPGPFYVDARCIDCGTCWGFDPDHFGRGDGHARVHCQPRGDVEQRQALLALQACPVAAIQAPSPLRRRIPPDGFPALICRRPAGAVYYCGWAAQASFGASSYLVVRRNADGQPDNLLIDSPRFNGLLARRLALLGGVQRILLTHRDDVADHGAFARHFDATRLLHRADREQATATVEQWVDGEDAFNLDDTLRVIPTPGHTPGSLCFLFDRQVLFSGDHCWWRRGAAPGDDGYLGASQQYCWGDWAQQLISLERLRSLDVRWLLPGHGERHCFAPGAFSAAVATALAQLQGNSG